MTPEWLMVARSEQHRDVVDPAEYKRVVTYGVTYDRIGWAAAFVNWCLYRTGLIGTDRAMALSFLWWGAVPLDGPAPGAIVVIGQGAGRGYVGILDAVARDRLVLIGAMSGSSVGLTEHPAADMLGIRWPLSAASPLWPIRSRG